MRFILYNELESTLYKTHQTYRMDKFSSNRTPIFLCLSILASYFFLFPLVFLGITTFFDGDFSVYSYPVAQFAKQSLLAGKIPLWDPYSMLGVPFLAQWTPMVFYPPTILYILFPTAWGMNLFNFLHITFGGLGMFYLIKKLTSNVRISILIGYLFAFNGLTFSLLTWVHATATYSWMPWVLLTSLIYIQEPKFKNLGYAALATGLQLLTGTPEIILITWLALFCLLLQMLGIRQLLQNIPKLILLISFSCCIAAVELLPFFTLLHSSTRVVGFAEIEWKLTLKGLVNLICPLYNSSNLEGEGFYPKNESWLQSYYITGFIFLAVVTCKLRKHYILLTGILFGVLAGFGWFSHFPPFSLIRFPIKFIILVHLLCFLIAGLSLCSFNWRSNKILLGIIVSFLCLLAARDGVTATTSMMLSLTLGLICIYLFQSGTRLYIILPLLFATVALHNPKMQPTVEITSLEHPQVSLPNTQNRFCEDSTLYKWSFKKKTYDIKLKPLVRSQLLIANANLPMQLHSVQGFFPMELNGSKQASDFTVFTNQTSTNLLDFLNVQYTPEHRGGNLTGNWQARSSYMPLVTVGQLPMVAADKPCNYWPTLDFRRYVLVEQNLPGVTNDFNSKVIDATYNQHAWKVQWDIKVSTESRTIVVISQSWYRNWVASVNGKPAEIYRVNGFAQGIVVPPGVSTVVVAYKDNSFTLGVTLSAICFITSLFLTSNRCKAI